jgi:hypothetical protein
LIGMPDLNRCTYPGCTATTERPATDGRWAWFQDLGAPGLPDGFYCPAHSAAICLGHATA